MHRIRHGMLLVGLVGILLLAGALPAVAQPTCADFTPLEVEVHGHHVVRDYVTGGAVTDWPPQGSDVGAAIAGHGAVLPGGPGPAFHFEHGFAPGASFCLSQSQSPGFHAGD